MLKICTCAQSHALGTCTKFQLEIFSINVIPGTVYFCEIILESSQNVSETPQETAAQRKQGPAAEQSIIMAMGSWTRQ